MAAALEGDARPSPPPPPGCRSRPAPRRAPRPTPPRPSLPSKVPGARLPPPHFHSPPLRSLSVPPESAPRVPVP